MAAMTQRTKSLDDHYAVRYADGIGDSYSAHQPSCFNQLKEDSG
jgi:hypothetical protein